MTVLKTLFLLAGATLASVAIAPCAHAQQRAADLPSDVRQFVGRRAHCVEWSRKASNQHATHLDDIASIMRSLRCDDVAADEQALREKYANEPATLAALNATWTIFVQRLSPRIPVPSNVDK